MDLYVRSQDKKNLVKIINQIGLNYSNNNMIIANYQPDFIGTQGEYYETLGTYATKERAFEVLNEIQNILRPKTLVLKDLNKLNEDEMNQFRDLLSIIPPVNSIQELPTYVYEMPEE